MDIDTKEIQVVKTQVTKAEQAVQDLDIKTDEDLAKASDLRNRIKAVQKVIKEKSDSFTRPAYQAYKDIMTSAKGFFGPFEERAIAAEAVVSQKMLTYRKEQDAIAAEAQRQQDEAAKKLEAQVEAGRLRPETAMKKLEAMPAVPDVKKSVEGASGKTTFRTIPDILIDDLSAIPDEYWELNMVRLRADALGNKAKGIAPIAVPGVKVVEKTTLA